MASNRFSRLCSAAFFARVPIGPATFGLFFRFRLMRHLVCQRPLHVFAIARPGTAFLEPRLHPVATWLDRIFCKSSFSSLLPFVRRPIQGIEIGTVIFTFSDTHASHQGQSQFAWFSANVIISFSDYRLLRRTLIYPPLSRRISRRK
ncbi:hypothetical protein [Paraburkholderia sp. HD33-4]|uniref:hypothetical protein n=1 Tax=Paraburkholderia sp. HD33-4 TaxID=2883242 RepID=UPI001F366D50|nr:hypothetical protein [Paraburkholderia sp. HD33-4]